MPGALLAVLFLLFPALPALGAEAAVATEVPAGRSKSIRVRGVPAGTIIAVRVVTTGRILVSLIGMRQIKEPQPGAKPLFRGAVQDRMSFRVTIPQADDYVLVLSNRAGSAAVNVEAEIRAARRAPKPAPRDYSPRPEKASWSPM